jgi:hypothetical protein
MTERDRRVYEYLKNNAKYVTTSQIAELFFTRNSNGKAIKSSKLICRRRMATMERYLPDVQSFYRQANTDKIYTTTALKVENIVALSQIEHSLKLNDLYIQIREYADKNNHKIHTFRVEPTLKDGLIPDILLIYVKDKKARIFFIEYDRSTETLTRIKKKIERYELYMSKQLYLQEDWQPGTIKPEVVFICEDQHRTTALQKRGIKACANIQSLLTY